MSVPSDRRTAWAGTSGTSRDSQLSAVHVTTVSSVPKENVIPVVIATGNDPVIPPVLAEMLTEPTFRTVRNPAEVTVATLLSDDIHVNKGGETALP